MKYLFGFFLFICANLSIAQTQVCGISIDKSKNNKTYVLFVNGIINSLEQACASSDELGAAVGGTEYDRSYFYNQTEGADSDINELSLQATVSDSAFKAVGISDLGNVTAAQKQLYYAELGRMYDGLRDAITAPGKRIYATTKRLSDRLVAIANNYERILIVPHSQGNFYTESAYALLYYSGELEVINKIKVVGVASVAATTPSDTYLSNSGDLAVFKAQWLNTLGLSVYRPLTATDSLAQTGTETAISTSLFHNFVKVYLSDYYYSPEKGNKSYRLIVRDYVKQFLVPPSIIGPNSSSGTYTWIAATGSMTLTTTSSNFVCSGPKMGADPIGNGITVSSTTMTWLPPDSTTWTRSVSGAANDIVGTWTATMQNGLPFILTFNADGSYSASGTDECAGAWANYGQGSYSVGLEYRDPSATAVSVTGPGITGSAALTYNASYSSWGGVNNQSYQVDLGATSPTGLPYAYTFTATTASGTKTETSFVTCFPQELVSSLAPTGTASGAITFSWTGITDPGATYGVWLQDPNSGVNAALWNVNGLTGTSVAYAGPTLTLGTTYNYSVQASGGTCNSGSTYFVGSFTYQ